MNYRTQNRNTLPLACRRALAGVLAAGIAFPALTQDDDEEDDIFELSPFEVSGEDSTGYRATSTLAGTRLRTELKDVGSAIQAVTKEFMEDIGATDNTTLLQYTTNTEVSGTEGNFAGVGNDQTLGENSRMRNPHSSTRVRGLQQADNARDFYQSVIPWDGYNVERVDIQRGANSILFGLGSPAGIVNADIADANFGRENGKIGLRFDEHGSVRTTFDYNKVLLEDELAVRVSILNDNEKYQQRYAFEDDQRLFVAMRYEPSFLKSERTRTSIRAKYEDGSIERNSPRILPPVDLMTPFFNDDQLGKVGIIPRRADDGNSRLPGHGITDEFYDDNVTPNPYYNPWVGSFAQVHGGLVYVFDDPVTGSIQDVFDSTPKTDGGIDSTGAIDATLAVGGRLKGIENYGDWTKAVSLPGSEKGLYKDTHITDTSIFDYYNNLLEGPNKGVTADFDAKNIVLEQTFFNNSLGFEFAYDEQTYADEQLTILNGWKYALSVDINAELPDGSANPNYGRPFVSDSPRGLGNSGKVEDDTTRVSAYWDIDLEERMGDGFLGKLFGSHLFNAAHVEWNRLREERQFQRWATDTAYGEIIGKDAHDDNQRHTNYVVYLGDSLANASTASGANIQPISATITPVAGTARIFDSTWNAFDVDPAAPWTDPFNNQLTTQSENPANYIGWTNVPVGVLDAANMDDRQGLYRSLSLSGAEVESEVAVWQGRLWNNSILPMLAYREDTASTNSFGLNSSAATGVDATIDNIDSYTLNPDDELTTIGEQKSKGLVVHMDRLIGSDRMPFELSLFYNESENFNPGERRVDVFGNAIEPPTGDTEDYGFLLSTKDGKYSARVTWYESQIDNATNNVLSGNLWQLGVVENWAINNAMIIRDMPAGRASWEFLNQFDGESDADFEQRRIEWTQVVFDNLMPREFHEAWGIENVYTPDGRVAEFDGDGGVDLSSFYNRLETAKVPEGLVATSDTLSEGVEFEFYANPTKNWSIAFNAAKTEAFHTNVGGALAEYVEIRQASYQNVVNGRRFGDTNTWGTSNGGPNTIESRDADLFASLELLKLLDGSSTTELRKWRANLVTNYRFSEGKFKGVSLGMGYRWQDESTLGYPLMDNGEGGTTFDISNPHKGPSESNFDFWAGYGKKLGDRVNWRVQLNVSNAFQDDNLIPVSVQPDGTVAGVRIGPSQNWKIQNTFEF